MLHRIFLLAVTALWTMGFSDPYLRPVTASYYATGAITANGEPFYPAGLTAAHRRYPFGTLLRVRNTANNLEVVVRVNDRGPYIDGRALDLSVGAAMRLGMIDTGLADVIITVVK